jgi:hypothetical protein
MTDLGCDYHLQAFVGKRLADTLVLTRRRCMGWK